MKTRCTEVRKREITVSCAGQTSATHLPQPARFWPRGTCRCTNPLTSPDAFPLIYRQTSQQSECPLAAYVPQWPRHTSPSGFGLPACSVGTSLKSPHKVANNGHTAKFGGYFPHFSSQDSLPLTLSSVLMTCGFCNPPFLVRPFPELLCTSPPRRHC